MDRSVTITEDGRSGHVIYREADGERTFYWEFGGGDVVASIHVGNEAEWRKTAAWAAERRADIVRFIAAEVVRQRAPSCRADIDDHAGWIHIREAGAGHSATPASATPGLASAAAPTAQASAAPRQFPMERWRSLRTKAAVGVLVVAAVAGGAVWFKNTVLVIDPGKGAPAGSSLRTDAHIATLIQTLEPYTPSLNRDHSKDRYRLSILVVPLDASAPYLIPVAGNLAPSTYSLAKILGSDGRTLWLDAAGLYGVDLKSRALVTTKDLRKANPSVDAHWWEDTRGMEVERTLRITARDRSQALDIEPATLKAAPIAPQRSKRPPFEPTPDSYLASMPCPSPTMRKCALLRLDAKASPVNVANPDSTLMAYSADASAKATLSLARIDAAGASVWSVDTGIDRFTLRQILPGEKSMAFIGTRPPVPDKVSEPLLVIVDNASGRMTTHSLWR